jgi:plasmid stability protein
VVATIQIRDVPDDVHEELRRQARANGQSLQAYMRDWVVERTRVEARRAAVLAEWAKVLEIEGGASMSIEEILEARDAERR